MKGRQVRRSRPQPLCANCGGPVDGLGASITLTALALPGRPRVVWHGACAQTDGACDDYVHRRRASALILVEIDARGPGRVARDEEQRKKVAH